MMDWLIKNKEWLFSGLGIFIIALIWRLLKYFGSKKYQPPKIPPYSGNDLTNIIGIFKKLSDTPPLQFNDVKKYYIGIKVKFNGELLSAQKREGDLIRVAIKPIGFAGVVDAIVSSSEYPEVGLMKQFDGIGIVLRE